MTWVRLDEQFPNGPAIVAAGPLGMALHVSALCYSNANLTDGFVPRSIARRLIDLDGLPTDPDEVINALVSTGLWSAVDGGYQVHDDNQPSKAEILERQQKKSEAGRRGGQARAQNRAVANGKHAPSTRQADASGVLEGDAVANGKPDPIRPVVPLEPDGSSGSPGGDRDNPPTLTVIDGGATEARKPEPAPPAEVVEAEAVDAEPVTARTLMAEHIDACPQRPPQRVIGHLSRELKQLVGEGIDAGAIRAGLAIVRDRGLNPSTLASAVNEVLNPPRPRTRHGPARGSDRRREQLYTNDADMRAWAAQDEGGDRRDQGRMAPDRQPHQRELARPAGAG